MLVLGRTLVTIIVIVIVIHFCWNILLVVGMNARVFDANLDGLEWPS